MHSPSKDPAFVRGVAAVLLALVAVSAAHAQGAGAGPTQPRPMRGDSIMVRVIDGSAKVRIDSIMTIMRQIEMEPAFSEQAHRLRRSLEAVYQELRMSGIGVGGPNRLFLTRPGEELRLDATRIRGWIGINVGMVPRVMVSDSSGTFEHYLRYPQIISVEPNSPALRAGIAPGDVLIAYDGQDVVRTSRLNMSELIVPERKLDVTVRRDGENRDFTLIVAKTPERIIYRRLFEPGDMIPPPGERGDGPPRGRAAVVIPGRPMGDGAVRVEVGPGGMGGARGGPFGLSGRVYFFERAGVFGASLINISADLAKAWKLDNGVLIDQCGEETPAFRAGLRTGDIVVSVGGQAVNTVGDVLTMVQSRSGDRAVGFQIVREKKPMAVTVKW